MFRFLLAFALVLALAVVAQACPQQVVAQGQCYGAQNVVVQQPQLVVAQQYAVVPQAVVVQQQYGAQNVVVRQQRQRSQKIVVNNGRQRSRQTVIVRNR